MKYMDIKPVESIYDLSLGDLIRHYTDDYKRSHNITIGTKIPVKDLEECWVCDTPFLTNKGNFCSERCSVLYDQAVDESRGK